LDEDEPTDALFDTLLERVEDEQAESQARVELAPQAAEDLFAPEPSAPPVETVLPFTDNEWVVLREIITRFERPIPFNQIHNALREARNSAGINRTNEELRTLIKQAINNGLLERSGKGNHIVYRLAQQAAVGDTPDQATLIEHSELYEPEAAAQ